MIARRHRRYCRHSVFVHQMLLSVGLEHDREVVEAAHDPLSCNHSLGIVSPTTIPCAPGSESILEADLRLPRSHRIRSSFSRPRRTQFLLWMALRPAGVLSSFYRVLENSFHYLRQPSYCVFSFVISGCRKPFNSTLAPKPRHLAFCIPPRVSLECLYRLGQPHPALEVVYDLLVAYRLPRGCQAVSITLQKPGYSLISPFAIWLSTRSSMRR